jgi:hypothetical protein
VAPKNLNCVNGRIEVDSVEAEETILLELERVHVPSQGCWAESFDRYRRSAVKFGARLIRHHATARSIVGDPGTNVERLNLVERPTVGRRPATRDRHRSTRADNYDHPERSFNSGLVTARRMYDYWSAR